MFLQILISLALKIEANFDYSTDYHGAQTFNSTENFYDSSTYNNYPVPIPQPVPVTVPHEIKIPIPLPYKVEVAIPQPIPIEVVKEVEIFVDKPEPYVVEQKVRYDLCNYN